MSATLVAFLCAGIGAGATLLVWMLDGYELQWLLRPARGAKLSGEWIGWSIYVPVDGFFSRDREAIYDTVVSFKQVGRRITFEERLTGIYDIDGKHLSELAPRSFKGRGTVGGNFDISARFWEKDGLTIGSMHIVLDARAGELTGILAVRPQIPGRPVAVRMLLRKVGDKKPTWKELGVSRLRALAHDSA